MNVRTIVFDFGNVLGFFSHRKVGEQLAAYGEVSLEAIVAYAFGGKLEDDYEAGHVSTAVLMGMMRETFHLRCTDEQFAAAFGDMFTPNPAVCELVPRLKPRYRLLLLSNTNELHARWFRRQFASTLEWFDGLILSYEVGLRKPDPRIYQLCQQRAQCEPGECLFIDDLPTNVEAARGIGWQGIVYRKGDDLRRELAGLGVVVGGENEKGRER
jgi:putative hydrolase of the HAD superfamily